MRLARLVLRNWMVYRGQTELVLDAKSYAVVARLKDDPERSNWLGKSALLEAVDFAVHGRLNADRKMGADGWVSDGEKEGSVLLELDDGTIIERARKRSTQLYVTPRGGKTATKDEAQQIVDAMVGLSADDFVVTSYFRQRKLSQFILTEPERRMGFVRAWFRLDPLEAAEESVRGDISQLSWRAGEITRLLADIAEHERRALGEFATREKLEEQILNLERQYEEEKGRVARLERVLGNNAESIGAKRIIEQRRELEARTAYLSERLQDFDGQAVEELATGAAHALERAREERRLAYEEHARKQRLALAQFDGQCPVANMPCPVSATINAQRDRNATLAQDALAVYQRAKDAYDVAERDERQKRERFQEYRGYCRQLDETHASWKAGTSSYEWALTQPEPADVSDLQVRIAAAQERATELRASVERLRSALTLVKQGMDASQKMRQELEELEPKIATHREALVIFGKNGAQRRVAEAALKAIQDSANAMLEDCGIKLDVEVYWTREGAGPAKACDACGQPFPASRKAKACDRCGAERGPLLVNKLDIAMSEQSGGSEDLAGAGIQLAAGAWLRQRRGARWSVALIDEPFGQLDAVHRRAFSAHLATMLRGRYGFEQALVIAHHSSVLDALPGRIEVINDGTKSTARVVA